MRTGNFDMEMVVDDEDSEPRVVITAWWHGQYWGCSIPLKPHGLDTGANDEG